MDYVLIFAGLIIVAVGTLSWRSRDWISWLVLIIGVCLVIWGFYAGSNAVETAFSWIVSVIVIFQAIVRAIKRTEFYKTLIGAFKAVPEIRDSAKNIEKKIVMVRKGARKKGTS